jgi:hypothetical protein
MALPDDGFEKHEEIEIGAREISFIQHIAEIISLASASGNGHF